MRHVFPTTPPNQLTKEMWGQSHRPKSGRVWRALLVGSAELQKKTHNVYFYSCWEAADNVLFFLVIRSITEFVDAFCSVQR